MNLFVRATVLCLSGLFALSQLTSAQSELESGKKIPVYPGAKLITEVEEGDSKNCCNFASSDGFDKVIAFYENSLKIKPLDVNGLATQLPFLKQQTEMMLKEMPPTMKIRFFVLKVVDFQGQKGAELFEVYTSPRGVEFSIMDSQLTTGDSHFSADYENAVSGKPAPVDLKIMKKALPVAGPSGYQEEKIDEVDPEKNSVFTAYSKLLKKGTGGEDGTTDLYSGITISISEEVPEFLETMVEANGPYEKSLKVKGKYRGIQRIEDNGNGYKDAMYNFIVKDKYLVEIHGNNLSDPAILNQLIDKMNVEALP
jgi:hypothetical protein